MKKLTIFASLILMVQLFLPFSLNVKAEESTELFNYLALGDSLAAGMDEKGEIGYGYADYLALLLAGEDEEAIDFNKGFAYPGYTTDDVLKDITADVTKPITDLTGITNKTLSIKQAIKDADFITLSVGANDVLKNVKKSETGQLSVDLAGVTKSTQDVAVNYEKIFAAIYELNPEADVVVMGLYNPFPYIQDASVQTQLNTLVSTMNKALQTVVEKNDGIYSNVAELIAGNFTTYLPNPQNIHLAATGYGAVAEMMLSDYIVAILGDYEDEYEYEYDDLIDTPSTEAGDYFTDIADHWGNEYINLAYMGGFMNGFEDGTFKPNALVTRAQVLSVIARAFELPATKPAPFVDIKDYPLQTQNEIAAAYEAGLVKENGGYLNPKDNVTRAQFALILTRLSNSFEGEVYVPDVKAPFSDIAKYDEETQNAITLLYDLQLVQGQTADKFDPAGSMTRAQLAKILVLAFLNAEE
ncbi:endoglucanase [Solibacillus sp. R5-41]|uniref:S-layer homology domain-containing protein n=1 Tax=Solibacillus sp. R5-41 TaxID=2048654 RepID=UPI000C124A08|nr:S-layer homology domain-containing protein [Solibacillus sp. R5-41]ATP42017.1 endoglucanase [Solibacillus sp. R5-41]